METLDLLDEVIVVPRRAFPLLPDLRVIERPGWLQIVTPSFKDGGLNEVIHSCLDEQTVDATIDEAIAIYRDLGLKFRWDVGPGSGPADLGARLEQRGLAPTWVRGMARSTETDVGGADIVEVDARTVEPYTHVMATGWDIDAIGFLALHRYLLSEGRQRLFLAYADGEPAAAASYISFPRSAYLMGAVVLPSYRGRGLYRALVQTRLAHARARGIMLATSHAREATSAPILEKLGFDTVCRFPKYYG